MHNNSSVWLGTKRLKNPPLLINTQHYSLFQIAISSLSSLIKAVFHPASYTCAVDRSLSGAQAKLKVRRLHMQITQSQDSENAQRNLEIAQILRLHGTDSFRTAKLSSSKFSG